MYYNVQDGFDTKELSHLQGEAHCQTRDQSGQWHHGNTKFVAEAFVSHWQNVQRERLNLIRSSFHISNC